MFTDEVVLAALRAASDAYGGRPLTAPRYERWSQDKAVPSVHLIGARFGWVDACKAAGVATIESSRTNYERRWSNDALLAVVESFIEVCRTQQRPCTYRRFAAWCAHERAAGSAVPSAELVRLRLGRWAEIVNALHERTAAKIPA